MIDKLSRKLTQKLIDKEVIAFEDWEVYMYGLQMLISGAVKFIGFMAIAWMLGWVVEALVFIITFSMLRVNAGGYHADTYLKCFVITSGFAFLSICLVKTFYIVDSFICTAIILAVAAALVLLYAPVDTPNKRMIGKEKSIFRKKSIIMMCMETSIIVIAYLINPLNLALCNIAAMAMLCEGLTLTPLIAANSIKRERGYCNEE